MNKELRLRVIDEGRYVALTGATVRATAQSFGISKSTVHKDLTQRLPYLDGILYEKVCEKLALNRAERHIRGGMATKRKYKVDKTK